MRIYRTIPAILQAPIYLFTRGLFSFFGKLEVRGLEHMENLPEKFILAPNHSSEWDGPLVRSCLPFFWKRSPMYYVSMAKERYTDSGWRKLIYGGHLFNLLGAYPVYSGKHDYEYSLQNHLKIVCAGRSLCIFPEGQRTKTGQLGPAHGGVAYLARHCDASVVPVGIQGIALFKMSDFLRLKRKVTVTFGAPIPASSIVPQEKPEIADYKAGGALVMAKISLLLQDAS